ncbi:hypothetical protein AAVH_26346 [Aphelenchoides avenae]|nr:hypothetical protein AAVH_26346 [Aphelenchus avenae]
MAVVHEHMKRAMLAFTLDDFLFEMHGRFAVTDDGVCYTFSPKDRIVLSGTENAVPIYNDDDDIPPLAERREVV